MCIYMFTVFMLTSSHNVLNKMKEGNAACALVWVREWVDVYVFRKGGKKSNC